MRRPRRPCAAASLTADFRPLLSLSRCAREHGGDARWVVMIVAPGDAVGVYGHGAPSGTTSVGSPGVVGHGYDRPGLNSDRMQWFGMGVTPE
jgi:hypothetical protein